VPHPFAFFAKELALSAVEGVGYDLSPPHGCALQRLKAVLVGGGFGMPEGMP
jgi:hypothetical protein